MDELEKIPLEYLQGLTGAPEQKGMQVKTIIESGDAAAAVCDVAMREGCDLIVMSTHGRSGLRRWVMGSVTEKVLRHAPVAVYAVQSSELPRHFLLTLDGSSTAELAIEPTLALASLFNSKVTFASIQDPDELPDRELINSIGSVDDGLAERVRVEWYDRAHQYISRLIPRYQARGLELEGVISENHPAVGILELAKKRNCDVIAMSTHGRTGLSRWRYGSVTEKVLRQADRNMLIIRAELPEEVPDDVSVSEMAPAS